LSASISCSEALATIQRGERLPPEVVRTLGENDADFFRIIIESLADSFDPAQVAAYEDLMRAWMAPSPRMRPRLPERLDRIYVLSRVTLGADIKITSMIFDLMKRRFPEAQIVFIANRKSAELFAADSRISICEADYPRSGPVSVRLAFAEELRHRLEGRNRIVIDPDSRMTQLGLVPVCEPEHYFHFPSRIRNSSTNLSCLTNDWLVETFGQAGDPYIAPEPVKLEGPSPHAAVSLGVGGNENKRLDGDFETRLIRLLAEKFRGVWIDRGAGGEEARRVTAAAEASGFSDRIRFWEGSFAGFASVIAQSDLYAGYDSAGQHAAAAAGTPLISIFAGAASDRFLQRWSPQGPGRIDIISADLFTPAECMEKFTALCCSGKR
jgi:ADP-heptose:LPS heptosyltransferase